MRMITNMFFEIKKTIIKDRYEWGVIALIFIGLIFLFYSNYLLFHSFSELIAIVISVAIFFLIWNTRYLLDNTFLRVISLSFLFTSFLDSLHFLAYKGMSILEIATTPNISVQLWISGRYIQTLSLLLGLFFIRKKVNYHILFSSYLILTTLLLLSIFYWQNFPTCYLVDSGLTPFKIVSEYVIIFLLLISVVVMNSKKGEFDPTFFAMLAFSLVLTIFSELMFTLYFDVFDSFNFLGHILKTLSFLFLYKGIYSSVDPLFENIINLASEKTDLIEKKYHSRTKQLLENLTLLENYKHCLHKSSIISLTDIEGNFLDVNDAFCKISKYNKDELLGRNYSILHSGYHSKLFLKDLWNTILEGQVFHGEICNKAKDGTLFWTLTSIVPFYGQDNEIYQFMTIKQDITELIYKRDELVKAGKFSAIGEISAQLLHDTMSPLSVIKNSSKLIQSEVKKLGCENSLLSKTEKIENAISKIENLFSDLRKFLIRPGGEPATPEERRKWDSISMKTLIETSIHNSQADQRKDITIYNNVKPKCQIKCLPNQMTEVFINLINNSLDAISNQKEMWLSIDCQSDEECNKIAILFTDSGNGISPEIGNQIFDSLFTTKQLEGGTGLGLATCKRIIEFHGGSIKLNDEHKNTQFIIELPNS